MARKTLIGMLLLGALVVFALATFYIENWQFTVLSKGYKLSAHFERALDLSAGDEVRIAGVEVGRVHRVWVNTQTPSPRPVEVELWILNDARVRAEDTARIAIRSIFGGSYVTIQRGEPTATVLRDGDRIENTKVSAGITDVAIKAQDVLSAAEQTFVEASEGLGALTEVATRLLNGEGAFGKLLTEDAAYDELREILAATREAFEGIEEFTTQLQEGKGLLARLLTDEELAADVEKTFRDASVAAENLRAISDDLREGNGLLTKLLTDEKLARDAEGLLDNAAVAAENLRKITTDLSEGKGPAGRLLYDEEMGAKLEQIITDAQAFTGMLAEFSKDFRDSSLGKMASDDELYRKLTATLDQLKETVSTISEGKGTFGKLIKDDKLYRQLSTAMESVQGLLDDYREQSPILTFAGAILGAL